MDHDESMILPAALRETVIETGLAMAEASDPWWIITGAAAALYGAHPITVSDVDVMLSTADAKRLFHKIGIQQEPPSIHPRFRSEVFGQWKKTALNGRVHGKFPAQGTGWSLEAHDPRYPARHRC